MKRASKHLDKCEDLDCKFNVGNKCCYGLRSTHCYMIEDKENIIKVQNQELIKAYSNLLSFVGKNKILKCTDCEIEFNSELLNVNRFKNKIKCPISTCYGELK